MKVSESKSVLAGALTLAIMILPTIIRAAEEAILSVPKNLYNDTVASLNTRIAAIEATGGDIENVQFEMNTQMQEYRNEMEQRLNSYNDINITQEEINSIYADIGVLQIGYNELADASYDEIQATIDNKFAEYDLVIEDMKDTLKDWN